MEPVNNRRAHYEFRVTLSVVLAQATVVITLS